MDPQATHETSPVKAPAVEMLDFWAEWCGPCKLMTPIIEELQKEYKDKLSVRELNVDASENQELVEKYQVMSIPTYIFLKDGEVVDQAIGAQSKDAMKKKLDAAIKGEHA